MAKTGPSATMASCLSVTTVAISMIESDSGLSPVISRSIQIRWSRLGIGGGSKDWLSASLPEATLSGLPPTPRMTDTFDALVVATFGRHLLVRDPSGRDLKARPFGRGLTIVCGDTVECRSDPHNREIHALELRPRRNALFRSNARGGAEPVVANLSQLLVVLAPMPVPDLFVLDRYLAAATSGGIAATLVVNKSELGLSEDLREQLDVYR